MNWPITRIGQIETHKKRLKEREIKEWARLISQGKAVTAFVGDNIGNNWLANPTIFRPSKCITALKMRANVAGDRVALARAKIAKDIECRKCRAQKETLGHILRQCTSTKKERIGRHDSIKDFIIQRISDHDKEAGITREPTLSSPIGGVLKPDVVIKNRGLRGRHNSPPRGQGLPSGGEAEQTRKIRSSAPRPEAKASRRDGGGSSNCRRYAGGASTKHRGSAR